MPPTKASLQTTPYAVDSRNIHLPAPQPAGNAAQNVPVEHRQEHVIYDPADSVIALVETPMPNSTIYELSGAPNPGGDTLYLPYFPNKITSMRLPYPSPGSVTLFITDNLSGCRIFVDSIPQSNDVIVYHANTQLHTSGVNAWADEQTPQARGVLMTQLANARGDYGIQGLALLGSLKKRQYFLTAGNEERRKQHQGRGSRGPGRTRPGFIGSCFVCAFPGGAAWKFRYQVWGEVEYSRPNPVQLFFTDWRGLYRRVRHGRIVGTLGLQAVVFDTQRFL